MNQKFNFPKVGKAIAYVKAIDPSLLPSDVVEQCEAGSPVYAVHDEDGAPLAITQDRDAAFVVARQNELSLFSVH